MSEYNSCVTTTALLNEGIWILDPTLEYVFLFIEVSESDYWDLLLSKRLSLYSIHNSSMHNTCRDFKETLFVSWAGDPHHILHLAAEGNPWRQGAHRAKTSGDRQQQVGTHHWSSWSHPSQAHTDRCLEQCSDHGHIYQHSALSERKINQIRKVGTRKKPQQHSCFTYQSQVSLKNNMHAW